MSKVMVAFSGAIASGKSTISKDVASKLDWPRVSFGDYIRNFATQQKKDPNDRNLLQRLGQMFVQSNVQSFVEKVLAQKPEWQNCPGIVVDGLRHAEVRFVMQQIARNANFSFKHVHINLDDDLRANRASSRPDPIEPAMLAKYDSDLTEAQLAKVIPAYADVILDGFLPAELLVDLAIEKLELKRDQAIVVEG